jgi:hypothetical protein
MNVLVGWDGGFEVILENPRIDIVRNLSTIEVDSTDSDTESAVDQRRVLGRLVLCELALVAVKGDCEPLSLAGSWSLLIKSESVVDSGSIGKFRSFLSSGIVDGSVSGDVVGVTIVSPDCFVLEALKPSKERVKFIPAAAVGDVGLNSGGDECGPV